MKDGKITNAVLPVRPSCEWFHFSLSKDNGGSCMRNGVGVGSLEFCFEKKWIFKVEGTVKRKS